MVAKLLCPKNTIQSSYSKLRVFIRIVICFYSTLEVSSSSELRLNNEIQFISFGVSTRLVSITASYYPVSLNFGYDCE